MSMKKGLIFGFLFAFLVLGFVTMKRSMPSTKEDRVYQAVKVYMPYKLDKYIGGIAIIDSRTGEKEKPSSEEVFLRLDELESQWGKEHLKIAGDKLEVLGDNNQSITTIFLETQKEREFIHRFFKI